MIPGIRELKLKLEKEIKFSSKVFIVGHNGPDFDSIGSCIGLHVLATYLDKKAYIIVDDEDSKIEPGVKKIIDENKYKYNIIKKSVFEKIYDDDSLLIITDTNKKNMISVSDYLDKFKHIYVIDHHEEDENSIKTDDKYISLESSSASEIVTRVLNCDRVKYDQSTANYLLAGISLDTNRFKQSTTATTHDVAEKLIDKGADIDFVNNLFLEEFESYCRISNLIVNGTTIKKYTESLSPIQVSFTLNRNNPKEVYLKEDYAKAADRMMKFNGIDASFALGYVDDETVHISARGGKKVNVGKIMKYLGGGGNPQSAGGQIKDKDLFEVEQELMDSISEGLEEEENLVESPQTIKVKQIKKGKKSV